MMWLVFVVVLATLAFVVYKHDFFRLPGLSRVTTIAFFSLKIIAGIGLWAVYSFYYPDRQYADIWKYFDDSAIMYDAIHETPTDYFKMVSGIGIDQRIDTTYFRQMNHWHQQFENNLFNDSHTIIRFNAIVRLISFGNYHTHSLLMSFLAFIGLCAIYRWIYTWLYQWKCVVAFVLFVSPSLLFWSSGVLKEGILLTTIGLLIYHAWKYAEDRKKRRLLWIALCLFLLAITKLYMLAFIVPALFIGLLLRQKPLYAKLKVFGLCIGLSAASLMIHKLVPRFSPFKIIASKQNDFLNLARGGTYLVSNTRVTYLRPDQHDRLVKTGPNNFKIADGTNFYYWNIADNFADTVFVTNSVDTSLYTVLTDNPAAGSLLQNKELAPTPQSFLKAIPSAILNTTIRPLPWEVSQLMILPSIAENLLVIFLILTMIVFYKKTSAKSIIWFCIVFAVLTLIVIGLTTPVLGAIVRYRITAIPFFIFAILLHTNKENLVKKVPFLAKIL